MMRLGCLQQGGDDLRMVLLYVCRVNEAIKLTVIVL